MSVNHALRATASKRAIRRCGWHVGIVAHSAFSKRSTLSSTQLAPTMSRRSRLGEIWSNVPLNPETGLPVRRPPTCGLSTSTGTVSGWPLALRQTVNGIGERSSRGGMVTADVINAGTMKADRVRAGLLTDEKGNNFWT